MTSPLIQINAILQELETKINTHELEKTYMKLENSIELLNQPERYHYQLFMAEILAAKTRNYSKALAICHALQKDHRKEVSIGATLKKSYIYALSDQYDRAHNFLLEAFQAAQGVQELENTVFLFCKKIGKSSKQSKIINSLTHIEQGDQTNALRMLGQEFNHQIKLQKYFAAKMLMNLFHVCQNAGTFRTLFEQAQTFIIKYDQQNRGNPKIVEQYYINRKKYLSKITTYRPTKINKQKNDTLKILAYYKLKKAKLNLNQFNAKTLDKFEALSHTLLNKTDINPEPIQQFVYEDYNTVVRTQHIVDNKNLDHLLFNIIPHLLQAMSSRKNPGFRSTSSHFQNSPIFHECESNMQGMQGEVEKSFSGSEMVKVNVNSEGFQKRYFYFKQSDIKKGKIKLYYCSSKKKVSDENSYYDLKKLQEVVQGKKFKPFARLECKDFADQRCFTLKLKDQSRNFYVPNPNDYLQWINLFRLYLSSKQGNKNLYQTMQKLQGPLLSHSKSTSKKQQTNLPMSEKDRISQTQLVMKSSKMALSKKASFV